MRLGPLHLPAKCTPLVHHCSTQYLWFLLLRLNTLIFSETILLFISLSCQIYQQSAQLHDHVWWAGFPFLAYSLHIDRHIFASDRTSWHI